MKGLREPTQIEDFNAKGFGAGGLPPFFFAHLNRNWVIHPLVVTTPTGHAPPGGGGGGGGEGAWQGGGYGPGVGLTELSAVAGSSNEGALDGLEGEVDEEERQGEGPPAKRVCLMVPSSEVKQYQGGRGQERPQRRPCTTHAG